MATRLYATATVPPITVTPESGWESTSLTAFRMGSVNVADYSATGVLASGSGVVNDDTACYVIMYGPLAPQVISGTVKGQYLCREVNALSDARAQMIMRIVASNGTTFRGTLLAMDTAALANEFVVGAGAANAVNRKFPRGWAGAGAALTSQTAQGGDYLVIEIGFRNHGTNTSAVRVSVGDSTGSSDLPEDETTGAGTQRGWVELSQTLILAPGPSVQGSVT